MGGVGSIKRNQTPPESVRVRYAKTRQWRQDSREESQSSHVIYESVTSQMCDMIQQSQSSHVTCEYDSRGTSLASYP